MGLLANKFNRVDFSDVGNEKGLIKIATTNKI